MKRHDSMSSEFLYYMIGRLGFCSKLIGWIRAYLESTTISILVNGSPTQEIKPTRGLKQGDPMAPLLFLIMVEGLVRRATTKHLLEGVKVRNNEIGVNLL